jgi:hypothetical protein
VRFWSKDRSFELLTKILQVIKDAGPTTNIELNMVYQRIVAAAAKEGRIPGAPPRLG